MKSFQKLMLAILMVILLALWAATNAAAAAPAFLDPAEAFTVEVNARGDSGALLDVRIAPGYHLYRERFSLHDASKVNLIPQLPAGRPVFDEAIGQQVSIWESSFSVAVPPPDSETDWSLAMQGCADEGLCYPPQHLSIRWRKSPAGALVATVAEGEPDATPAPPATSATPAAPTASAISAQTATAPVAAAPADKDRVSAALASGSVVTVFGMFVVFGLLLSFTPCVLPMLPILSSIIVGQSGRMSRGRGLSLALSYSLGMALVYTAMGMLAGWLGQGLAGALQQPWVLGAFALLLVALALSMFGVWELQIPAFIQQRLVSTSNKVRGGNIAGVFAMGALSALLVGPCVAPPLAGVLVYISQAHDLFLGGLALFALACGMSVPLLLLGLSAGNLLPRAGAWMERVKAVFGILLLATALWLVAPVLPVEAVLAIVGTALLIGAGLLFWPPGDIARPWARAIGVPLAVCGTFYLAGAFAGGQDLLHPLASATRGASSAAASNATALDFVKVRSEEEFASAVAHANGRTIVVDYYADWCVSCKEMEHLTFTDAGVHQKLQHAMLVQVDVTQDGPSSRALLKRFGLFGPPGIVFLDAQGREKAQDLRVIGYTPAAEFARVLARAGL